VSSTCLDNIGITELVEPFEIEGDMSCQPTGGRFMDSMSLRAGRRVRASHPFKLLSSKELISRRVRLTEASASDRLGLY
jgi:hypothetical protein